MKLARLPRNQPEKQRLPQILAPKVDAPYYTARGGPILLSVTHVSTGNTTVLTAYFHSLLGVDKTMARSRGGGNCISWPLNLRAGGGLTLILHAQRTCYRKGLIRSTRSDPFPTRLSDRRTIRDNLGCAHCCAESLPLPPAERRLFNKLLAIKKFLCSVPSFQASSFRCTTVMWRLGDGVMTAFGGAKWLGDADLSTAVTPKNAGSANR